MRAVKQSVDLTGHHARWEQLFPQAPDEIEPMRRFNKCGRPRSGQPTRLGAAVVEMAICLPILTILVFGAIEVADLIHLKGYLRNISYEGGREAGRFNSDSSDVFHRMNALLAATAVNGAMISVDLPGNASDVNELDRGSLITIRVTAPAGQNTVGPLKLYANREITAEVTVVRE